MRVFWGGMSAVAGLLLAAAPGLAAPPATDELLEMSLESLLDLEVTSVSKRAESIAEVAAAASVLTGDDIRRSGHTSVGEALRMLPGLQVARMDANRWAIAVRGFDGLLSNKLLVLVDGRSVYSTISSGVYWDDQTVAIEEIDRIEVIRGPGGTLWGANAVNGVINIMTKKAKDTQGASATLFGGTHEAGGSARYGAKAGEDVAYRVDFRGRWNDEFQAPGSRDANDDWRSVAGGFRVDWDASDADQVSLHGEVWGNRGAQDGVRPYETTGGAFVARWNHRIAENNSVQLKVFNETVDREDPQYLGTLRSQSDVELQQNLRFDTRLPVSVTWGANYRATWSDTVPSATISLVPASELQHLASLFAQAQIDLLDHKLSLIAGTKLDYNDYTEFEYQPSFRVRATPWRDQNFWAAVSRAVREPSRVDRDINFLFMGLIPVRGNKDFESENLLAFEAGYRGALPYDVTAAISAFYFIYDDLLTSRVIIPPMTMGMSNGLAIDSYGGEAEFAWQTNRIEELLPIRRLRLSAGYSLIFFSSPDVEAGHTVAGEAVEQVTPRHQVQFRGQFDLPHDVEFDVLGYWVDELEGSAGVIAFAPVDDYFRLDLRVAWRPVPYLELSVVGQNLNNKRHQEFSVFTDQASLIPRSVVGRVKFDFF